MVALVLQAASQQAAAVYLQHGAIQLGKGGSNMVETANIGANIANAQAALCEKLLFAVGLDGGVDEHQRHDVAYGAKLSVDSSHFRLATFLLVLRYVNHNQANILTNLGCCEADAIGGIHRLYHIGSKRADGVVHVFYRRTHRAQYRIPVLCDGKEHKLK